MRWRFLLVGLLVGGFVAWNGWQDLQIDEGISSRPMPTERVDLESGLLPPGNWIVLGRRFRAYWGAVFQYRASANGGNWWPRSFPRSTWAPSRSSKRAAARRAPRTSMAGSGVAPRSSLPASGEVSACFAAGMARRPRRRDPVRPSAARRRRASTRPRIRDRSTGRSGGRTAWP